MNDDNITLGNKLVFARKLASHLRIDDRPLQHLQATRYGA